MERKNNKPLLNFSVDTQLLLYLIFSRQGFVDAIKNFKLNKDKCSRNLQTNGDEYLNYKGNLELYLKNYTGIEFIRDMLERGLITLNVTPTSFSELMNSPYFDKVVTEFLLDVYDLSGSVDKNGNKKSKLQNNEEKKIVKNYLRNLFENVCKKRHWVLNGDNNAKDQIIKEILYDPESNLGLYNDFLELVKKEYVQMGLSKSSANVNFINFPYFQNIAENGLAKDILSLSTRYRIDRKYLDPKTTDGTLLGRAVPVSEVNDCTIMATCALTGMMLVSEDYRALVNNSEIFEYENSRFNKKSTIKTNSKRVARGLPISTKDFILSFFQQEYIEFMKDFKIPEDIQKIDELEGGILQATDKYIKETEVPLLIKSDKNKNNYARNRKSYNDAFEMLSGVNAGECNILSFNDFFKGVGVVDHVNDVVRDSWDTLNEKITPDIIDKELEKFEKNLDKLESEYWKTDVVIDKYPCKIDPDQNNELKQVLSFSNETCYEILGIIDFILKDCLYSKTERDVSYEIDTILKKHKIKYICGSNGLIEGITFNGVNYKLSDLNKTEDLRNKKIDISFDNKSLTGQIVLLFGTNSFTFKGIERFLKIYLDNYKKTSDPYNTNNKCTDTGLLRGFMGALLRGEDTAFNKKINQIKAYLGEVALTKEQA